MRRIAFPLLVALALASGATQKADAAKRVALVIGNSEYARTQRLANPENDARLIASILRNQGFEVLEHRNLGFKAMKRAIKAYTSKLEAHGKDTVGLIFYAGHGLQSGGRNYLVPVDAQIEKEGDVEIETISSRALLSGVQFAGNRLNIIILDACRNNPYRGIFRSATRGFARMDAPVGSLVAFSTAPGTVAADGSGANSPYTAALAEAMVEPGLKIEDVFKRARATVYGATGGKQVPWESSSIFGDFFFAGDKGAGRAEPAKAPVSPAAQAWGTVKDTKRAGDLEAYIAAFPDSFFATLARSRLKTLTEQKVAVGVFPEKPKPAVGLGLKAGDEFQDCAACPKMMVVPAGSFTMGSPASESKRDDDEGPQRSVTIRKPFAVGKFEVTVDQFSTFVRESDHDAGRECYVWNGNKKKWEKRSGKSFRDPGFSQTGSHPAACLNWDDAKAYVAWLSRKTGKTYRLLSEAEWEYAARSGTTTRFHFGDSESDLCGYGNAADRSTSFDWRNTSCSDGVGEKTAEVGGYKANAFGLHDLHGNVWEWVEDCWNENYVGAPSEGSSRTSGDCSLRVLRGGSWYNSPWNLRSADRGRYATSNRDNGFGLRVARTLTP